MAVRRSTSKVERVMRVGTGSVACLVTGMLTGPAQASEPEREVLSPQGPVIVNTSDPALQGAYEALLDLPSALAWSAHQRGEAGGWRYVLYPDGTARITSMDRNNPSAYRMTCELGAACEIVEPDGSVVVVPAVGAPRPVANQIATGAELSEYLAQWVLARTGEPPKPEPVDEQNGSNADGQSPDTVTLAVASAEPDGSETEAQTRSADGLGQPVAPVSDGLENCPEIDTQIPSECAQPGEPAVQSAALPQQRQNAQRQMPNNPRSNTQDKTSPPDDAEPASKPNWIERTNLRCSLTGTFSLRHDADDNEWIKPGKPRASLGCSGRLTKKLSFRATLAGYLRTLEQEDWDPDFTYSLTYRVNDKLSLNYANYGARFNGPDGNFWDGLVSGNLRANYRLPKLELPNGKAVSCSGGVGLPNPTKYSTTLSCGYSVTPNLRVSGTLYAYFPGKQGTFQPDYSYTASYRFNENWTVSYNNYSNNRFPWNKGDDPGPGFAGGSVSMTYSWKF